MTRPHKGRISILTLLLLVSVAAVWIALKKVESDTAHLQSVLPSMRSFARILVVSDKGEFAAILKPISWPERVTWDIYVPESRKFEASLKLKSSDPSWDATEKAQAFLLPPGEHQLTLYVDSLSPSIELKLNETQLAFVVPTKEWADVQTFGMHDPGQRTVTEQTSEFTNRLVLVDESIQAIVNSPSQERRTAQLMLSVARIDE